MAALRKKESCIIAWSNQDRRAGPLGTKGLLAGVSDAGVPGIAAFWGGRAQALAEAFQTVGDG